MGKLLAIRCAIQATNVKVEQWSSGQNKFALLHHSSLLQHAIRNVQLSVATLSQARVVRHHEQRLVAFAREI